MAEGPIAHSPTVIGPAPPRRVLEVVRQHAPEIHERIAGPGNPELESLYYTMKKSIASQSEHDPALRSQIYSLPPESIATVLLNVYRPNENHAIMMSGPEIIEFIARWKGAEDSIPLPGSTGFVPSRPACGQIRPGSLQSFEEFVERWHAEPKPGCDADPEVASSEFSAVFAKALKAVESLASKNAGLLAGLAADAGEFVACLLATRPEAAAARLGIVDLAIADKRRISGMQPQGTYAEIGCGMGGVACMNALDRRLVLVDNNTLMTGILASYARRTGKENVDIRNSDIASSACDAGPLGLANIEYVLHYLSEKQITDAIRNLVPALADNGLMHIWEPEVGCCRFESPEKIKAIGDALAASGLFFLYRRIELDSILSSFGRSKWDVEFIAARREEELERARLMMDSAQFTEFA